MLETQKSQQTTYTQEKSLVTIPPKKLYTLLGVVKRPKTYHFIHMWNGFPAFLKPPH